MNSQENSIQKIGSSEPGSSTLTRDQFLNALDAQIDFVRDELRKPGWTAWAIVGALAGILWSGTDLLFNDKLKISNAVLFAFAVHSVWQLIAQVILALSPPVRVPAIKVGFRKLSEISGAVRLETAVSLFRHVSILVALYFLKYPGLFWVWAYSVVATIVYCAAFGHKWFDFAFSSRPTDRAGISFPTTLAQCGVLLFAISQVTAALPWKMLTIEDVRFAFLVNAAFCLGAWLTSGFSTPLLNTLVQIRQDYSFGRITLETAITHTELALTGLKLSDVLHPYVSAVLKEAGELQSVTSELHKKVSSIDADLISGEKLAEEQQDEMAAIAFRRIDSFHEELAELSTRKRAVGRARDRLLMRSRIIKLFSAEHDHELETICKGADDALLAADKHVKALEDQHRQLKEKANRLAEKLAI